jgi:ABC-2 type transport system permease protein
MADTLLWRPIPILTLTVRQFLGGKALWVVTVLTVAVPSLFAAIYLLDSSVNFPGDFLIEVVFLGVVSPTLLPIAVLILATGALGNEIEDRTLAYLVLKPTTRLRIVVEKLLGVLVVALPAVLAGLIAAYVMIELGADESVFRLGRPDFRSGDLSEVLWAMLGAASVGVVATAALFMLVSLVIPRALLVGIIYSFVWESLLGRFLPGVKVVSLRHYTDSVFVALLDDPGVTVDDAMSLNTSLIVVACLVAVSVAITTWRLRRMNLD